MLSSDQLLAWLNVKITFQEILKLTFIVSTQRNVGACWSDHPKNMISHTDRATTKIQFLYCSSCLIVLNKDLLSPDFGKNPQLFSPMIIIMVLLCLFITVTFLSSGGCSKWGGDRADRPWCFSYVFCSRKLLLLCPGARLRPAVLVPRHFHHDAKTPDKM